MATEKGGGYRGGPKRWTGNGPRPARHIPWPEIFKHHLSVVEGHLKMIDMVRKHCVPNSGNHRTISEMLDRSHEMLAMTKKASREFIPPPDLRDQVPIGSSSASMYPGYSPADHRYGEAAQDFGNAVTKARVTGVKFDLGADGPEYEVGQAKGQGKRKRLFAPDSSPHIVAEENRSSGPNPSMTDTTEGSNEYFIVDNFPTSNDKTISNKRKKFSNDKAIKVGDSIIEHEDITDKVDARMKVKEERRKSKKDKKRKREVNEKPQAEPVNSEPSDGGPEEEQVAEEPLSKKSRTSKDRSGCAEAGSIDDQRKRGDKHATSKDSEKKKRKKKND